MKTQKVAYFTLAGSYEEIGRQAAGHTNGHNGIMPAPEYFTDADLQEALTLYRTHCPGMVEELEGFAKASGLAITDIAYTWMTYLKPQCSGLIVDGSLMADGQMRLVRNYEFSIAEEDFMVCETRPEGKYAHVGGNIALFGRSEGINKKGLAVSMSSCGLPVSNLPGMRPPKVKGIQFWAVIRTLLENCKNVEEAMALVKETPIGYNINLYLADVHGRACLVETLDGHVAFQEMAPGGDRNFLCGTNHIVIPEFKVHEPYAMKNSVRRLEALEAFIDGANNLTEEAIKHFFLKKYPDGMSAFYYNNWFGTTKTVVMNPHGRTFDICWLGQESNGWDTFTVGKPFNPTTLEKMYIEETADPGFFEPVSL